MIKGEKCWIIENGMKVTAAEIVRINGNRVLIKLENGKALRLPKHRIFDSEERAKEILFKNNPVKKSKNTI